MGLTFGLAVGMGSRVGLGNWATIGVGFAAACYLGLVTGSVSLDLRLGRRERPLGPHAVDIQAPRELVFDIIAQPYLGRQTHAQAEKIRILERGTDMVLAAHYTPLSTGLVARTVETVRFYRPERVDFRLVHGPVPHVVEQFLLTEQHTGTRLEYRGTIAADLWAAGEWWADRVGRQWERVVAGSFDAIKAEAERRA
ncbi:MAG: SRPBCC family protein [Sporichthyaceae bacterium]|nr:SRPBCC family protein [Sporichthyaceae bacterium]